MSGDAQELAYAWESVGMPLDSIAEMHIEMQRRLGYRDPCGKCSLFEHWNYCASCGRKMTHRGGNGTCTTQNE